MPVDLEASGVGEDAVLLVLIFIGVRLVIAIGRHCGSSKDRRGCAGMPHPPGYCPGRMTTKRSPASTCWVSRIASRSTTPSTGAVIAASIFIASIDATG